MSLWRWLTGLLGRESAPSSSGLRLEASPTLSPAPSRRERLADDLLQFPDATSKVTDVVLGFDFGTSSVKAALRVPYMLGATTTVVDFGTLGHESNAFLLPAVVYRDSDDHLHLQKPSASVDTRRHLKLPLIDDSLSGTSGNPEALAWAVGFMALALREIRRRFLSSQAATYGSPTLRWSLNLGIPSAGYDDAATRARFAHTAAAAWRLSTQTTPTLQAARNACATGNVDSGIAVAVIPEIAAEVVAYAKSRQRREGLHLILDMGASTLDVAAVVLHRRGGEDAFSFLTADVASLGLLELHRRRMHASGRRPPFDVIPADLIAPLPGWRAGDSAGADLELHACDRAFIDDCAGRLFLTLMAIRRRRDPHSQTWGDSLPTFILGGGADAPAVEAFIGEAQRRAKSIFAAPERRGRRTEDWKGFRRESAVLDQLRSTGGQPTPAQARRLVVACGLAFPELDLGPIDPPHRVPDIEPNARMRDRSAAFVDKSQV